MTYIRYLGSPYTEEDIIYQPCGIRFKLFHKETQKELRKERIFPRRKVDRAQNCAVVEFFVPTPWGGKENDRNGREEQLLFILFCVVFFDLADDACILRSSIKCFKTLSGCFSVV